MTSSASAFSRTIRWWGALAAIAMAFLVVPALTSVPARLIDGCTKWIALAGGLELLSILGFIVIFTLVFGRRMSWRQSLPAGLRALGSSTILPAGGLIGPIMGARSENSDKRSFASLTRSAIALAILTNVPSVVVLGALGLMLSLGWPNGPHDLVLTLPVAGAALALVVAVWFARSPSGSRDRGPGRAPGRAPMRQIAAAVRALRDGATEARSLLVGGNWKLAGALGYYAFDNAVLWAAFRAYGHAPPLSVVVMGYVVGSLGSAVPLPGGIGAVEGGLIGALVLYGAPAGPAAAAVLLYRGVSLSLPIVLGACAWALRPAARPRVPIRSARQRYRARAVATTSVSAELSAGPNRA